MCWTSSASRSLSAILGVMAREDCACIRCGRAATNALSHEADIAKVQEWLGYGHVSTNRLNDRRKSKPEESPTFHVKYS
jgi:hypothetical protein